MKKEFKSKDIYSSLLGVDEMRINDIIEEMPLNLKVELVSKFLSLHTNIKNAHLKWREENNGDLPYVKVIGSNAHGDQIEITMNALSASMQTLINGKGLGTPLPVSREWIMFTAKEIGPNYRSWQNYVDSYIKNEAIKQQEILEEKKEKTLIHHEDVTIDDIINALH